MEPENIKSKESDTKSKKYTPKRAIELLSKIILSTEELSFDDKKNKLEEIFNDQVIKLLEHVKSINENIVSDSIKFHLEVKDSQIIDAGKGVYLIGDVPKGSVVAIYPGILYGEEDMIQVHQMVYADNNYLIMRPDALIIDGNEKGTSSRIFNMVVDRQRKRSNLKVGELATFENIFKNSYAKAHMVNHPPVSYKSNVVAYCTELPSTLSPELSKFIPNLFFAPDSVIKERHYTTKVLMLVSIIDISNAELLLNYNYNPDAASHPEWYDDSPYPTES